MFQNIIPPSLKSFTMMRRESRINVVEKESKKNIRMLQRDRGHLDRKEASLVLVNNPR